MFIVKETNLYGIWYDDFNLIKFHKDLTRIALTISKRKFLRNLSELEKINEVQLLILQYITQIQSIIYYPEDSEVQLRITTNETLKFQAKPEEFYDLMLKSIKDD